MTETNHFSSVGCAGVVTPSCGPVAASSGDFGAPVLLNKEANGAVTQTRRRVAALFVRSDSCYFDLAADCWDAQRDARSYTGPGPVVAHPPCRGWGRLRNWAKPRHDEKALALFAVECVRKFGGVLEHPYGSTLWGAAGLPYPQKGIFDEYGGWTLLVEQGWWGHAAPKPTYLYIVGVSPDEVGDLPVKLHRAAGRTLDLSPAEREKTPPEFAHWLVALASRARPGPVLAVTPIDRSFALSSRKPAGVACSAVTPAGALVPSVSRAADKRAALKLWADSL